MFDPTVLEATEKSEVNLNGHKTGNGRYGQQILTVTLPFLDPTIA